MEELTYVEGFHDSSAVTKMKYNELGRTGLRVSMLSIGGSPLGNWYEAVDEKEGIAMVNDGLRAGMNYIDTSPWYGNGRSEELIGKALRDVPRRSYYIATKVGRYETAVERMFDFSAERTLASVDKSLKLLGLDYVDVIQVHDMEFAEDITQIINETLPALQQIVDKGKAKYIGITSYSLELLKHVLDKSTVKIDTVLSYARNTMIDKSIVDYLPYFQSAGLGVINASMTGMGLLSSGGPQSWHPAHEDTLRAATSARELCKTRKVEIAHVALQSSLSTPGIATHLLGCVSAAMLRDSLRVAMTTPTPEEQELADHIQKTCFENLLKRDWTNREAEKYFKNLKEARNRNQQNQE